MPARILPAGTPAQITEIDGRRVLFTANNAGFELRQRFGTAEPFQGYLDRVLTPENPASRLAAQPPAIAALIREGKVAIGMTREQVLLSIGHPPRHATPSLDVPSWRYWYGRFDRFDLDFDEQGKVRSIRTDPNVGMARLWSGPR